ncbi:hypothetical protein [Litoreibacter halocynthiae]|nr:hypothetical protein [Litoreibacter halocynthiae]
MSFLAMPLERARAEEPLSAIGWLSNVVEAPKTVAPPNFPQAKAVDDVARTATPASVVTTTLGAPSRDAVGLVPSSVTGIPPRFWGTTSSNTLAAALSDLRPDLPPPLAELMRRLLLAELAPPIDSSNDDILFRARVDELLALGALDQAKALLDRADPGTAALFQRWFDVSLLTGEEDAACTRMLRQPDLSPTYPARIFCMARAGDWDAANLTLNTAKALDVMTPAEDALMARFLDPELFEREAPLPTPNRVTPLNFRMHEAIGEPLSLSALPNAFAFAALSENGGWKPRITAAERLARTGAILPSRLLAIYTERQPAASGGVWDRVDAVQAFEAALRARDPNAVAAQLPEAVRAMRRAGLEPALASMFGEALLGLPLLDTVRDDATRLALLSPAYEAAANSDTISADTPALWRAVARGDVATIGEVAQSGNLDALEGAVAAAFTAAGPASDLEPMIKNGNLGLATLKAVKMMEDGASADPLALENGLRTLRHLGFADIARRMALYALITRPRS